MYIEDIIYGIILDAKTSEHSARMNSMKNATDNAEELTEQLLLKYNPPVIILLCSQNLSFIYDSFKSFHIYNLE